MLRKTCCIVGKFCGTKGIWNNCDTSVSSTMKGNFLSSSIWAYMWLSITQGLMVLLSWRILTYCICLFPQSKKHWITLFTLSVDGTWTYLCTPPDHTFFKNLVICWIYCKYPIYLFNKTCFCFLFRHFCTESDKLQMTNSVSHLNMSRYDWLSIPLL